MNINIRNTSYNQLFSNGSAYYSGIRFDPEAGYFVMKNLAIGAVIKSERYYTNSMFNLHEYKQKSFIRANYYMLGAGIYATYSIKMKHGFFFNTRAEFNSSYSSLKYDNKVEDSNGTVTPFDPSIYNSFATQFKLSPGVSYFLNKKISINTYLLGLEFNKYLNTYNFQTAKNHNRDFRLDLSLGSFSWGMNYYF
jgi:hypothetical protein